MRPWWPAKLPRMFALLAGGQIHPVQLRIAEDETRILSDEDAARADAALYQQAPGLTLRSCAGGRAQAGAETGS